MATIRFSVKPLGNGLMQVRAMFQDGDTIKYKNIGYTLPDKKVNSEYRHWDKQNYKVKQHPNQDEINERINDWIARFSKYKKDCTYNKQPVNINLFIQSLSNREVLHNTGKPATFLDAAKQFYKDVENDLKKGTSKQYDTFIEDITNYQKKRRVIIRYEDVNAVLYKDFGAFLIKENNNYNNTINRKISRFVTVMNYATDVNRQWTTAMGYKKKYKFKPSVAARFPLLPDESKQLKELSLTNPVQQMYLDAFRFACETSLRFSDVNQLYPVHKQVKKIKKQTVHILDLTQVKTVHENTLALSDYALQIWNKYASDKKKRVFPINTSNAATNMIKTIFENAKNPDKPEISIFNRDCEIVRTQGKKVFKKVVPLCEAISFHMARNTAITFQLTHLPPALVMSNAGIKNINTLMGYYRDEEDRRYLETLEIQNRK